ncbi:MAG: DNA cytosine methyltransferase [Candidatus Thiodiazotropha endolucinida]
MKRKKEFSFYEFFAGGGMARAGLGTHWKCLFANDFDAKKAESYCRNWGEEHLHVKDVRNVEVSELPGEADLSWASFPCQDLSLAGNGGGLNSERSGSFWPFWKLMQGLKHEKRNPKIILLENVYGALTSHDGKDFTALYSSLLEIGYSVGTMVIDASHFVPQSRTRLFVVAVRSDLVIPSDLLASGPNPLWHPAAVLKAGQNLPSALIEKWLWWDLPEPPSRNKNFIDVIEDEPDGVTWKSDSETKKLLSMMSEVNRKKVTKAQSTGCRMVGGVYRRTRNGRQRAEVRFDNVSGCLRTPSGGSSRQLLLIVEGESVRSRLLSPREAARLMGLDDGYVLPENYNAAYHLAGDGVVVPVVEHLSEYLLTPILRANTNKHKQVA